MSKYYLSNDIRFLTGMAEGATCPAAAKHMKMSRATAFITERPQYSVYKERNSSKGNDYVISTPMKFVGNDGNVVTEIKKARSFSSADAAFEYFDTYRDRLDADIKFVITEKFVRQNRSSEPVPVKDVEKFEVLNTALADSTKRIVFPEEVRVAVFEKSDGVCELCGKPLYKANYTLDHIVPLSRGGTNSIKNLRAVHEGCNKMKGNMTDEELAEHVTDMCSKAIYNNPSGELMKYMVRSMVRGTLAKVGVS